MSLGQSATVFDQPVAANSPSGSQSARPSTVNKGSVQGPVSKQAQPAANQDTQVCWVEVKQYPYQPDHQVELLHLQAEADALLMKLQNAGRQQSYS